MSVHHTPNHVHLVATLLLSRKAHLQVRLKLPFLPPHRHLVVTQSELRAKASELAHEMPFVRRDPLASTALYKGIDVAQRRLLVSIHPSVHGEQPIQLGTMGFCEPDAASLYGKPEVDSSRWGGQGYLRP